MHKGDDLITTFVGGSIIISTLLITTILFLSWITS